MKSNAFGIRLTVIGLFSLWLFPTLLHSQSAGDIVLNVKTINPQNLSSIETGRLFQYQIAFGCNGPDSCRNVVLMDTLPLGLEFLDELGTFGDAAYEITAGTFNDQVLAFFAGGEAFDFSAPGFIVLSLGDLEPGASGAINLNVRFQQHGMIPDGYTVINSAGLSADNDLNPGNNSQSSPAIAAEAEAKWGIRKIALPGSLLFDASSPFNRL